MQNVQSMKAKLQEVITAGMTGLTLADITVERTKRMMELATPYINDDLIMAEVITTVTDTFTDKANFLRDCDVVDGVIYPQNLDEVVCQEVLDGFVLMMDATPADGQATIAAITVWAGEAMLNAA